MKKAKVIGIVIGVILFIGLIGGLTYAWLSWQSNNIIVDGTSLCFDIDYLSLQEIGTSEEAVQILLVSSYDEGDYAEVSLALDSQCPSVHGLATLYLNTNSNETDSDILSGALNYTVYTVDENGDEIDFISEGIIDTTDVITLVDDIIVNSTTPKIYRIYIWLNGDEVDNSYANLSYSGYISASAVSSDRIKSYEEMTPQEKLQHDVNLADDWFNSQRAKELSGQVADDAYVDWLDEVFDGSFPTCPSSEEDDLIDCFSDIEDTGDILPDYLLSAIGLEEKGIQKKSYHSIAFLNESTEKICTMLKINNGGGSYYETEYTTDFGNVRYMKSSGC